MFCIIQCQENKSFPSSTHLNTINNSNNSNSDESFIHLTGVLSETVDDDVLRLLSLFLLTVRAGCCMWHLLPMLQVPVLLHSPHTNVCFFLHYIRSNFFYAKLLILFAGPLLYFVTITLFSNHDKLWFLLVYIVCHLWFVSVIQRMI